VKGELLKLDLNKSSLLCFQSRFLSSNVYLIVIDDRAVAIDTGMPWTANRVLDYLNKNRLKLEYVFLTHSHFDHTMGLNRLQEQTKTKVVAHSKSKRGNVKVNDGDVLNVIEDKLSFLVIYTGFHKADHVWYYESNNQLLFIGDYLPTPPELETLKNRRGAHPKIILPGHGELAFL